jgi:hypothetical protein
MPCRHIHAAMSALAVDASHFVGGPKPQLVRMVADLKTKKVRVVGAAA